MIVGRLSVLVVLGITHLSRQYHHRISTLLFALSFNFVVVGQTFGGKMKMNDNGEGIWQDMKSGGFVSLSLLEEDHRNNLKLIDLSDLSVPLPLEVKQTKAVLRRSETWEYSTWDSVKDRDSLGFPSVVRNIYGSNADFRFYLFYAHHDPTSGIGCAVADSIVGPYVKIKEFDNNRPDSLVLVCRGRRGEPFHYSSPCVIWNEEEQVWFMYFHFYKNEWEKGKGHQKTAVAVCKDLTENKWRPLTDSNGELIPVIPTTAEKWMNSQSSYHAIQRLTDGTWLAFLRGTGGEYGRDGKWLQDVTKLGFAKSRDGIRWTFVAENPVIHQNDGGAGKNGVYRPGFVSYLGGRKYLVCWSESRFYDSSPEPIYGVTSDFKRFERDRRGYAKWPVADGLVSVWREGERLYLFTGKYMHTMRLLMNK